MSGKFSKISIDILKAIALIGMFAIAGGSPHFWTQLSRNLHRRNRYLQNKYSQTQLSKTLSRLKKANMVILEEKDGNFTIELSEKGKKKIEQIAVDDLKNKKLQRWDGIWRIVIFDIPEHQKYGRAALRGKMKGLGFYQLQKSVWVFPCDCEKEIKVLANFFEIDDYVNFIEAKKVSNDEELKRHFKIA